ncbi:MAG: glycoside hydrolase family 3 N-terminal domain-containing protein [Bacteroidota bacterium]
MKKRIITLLGMAWSLMAFSQSAPEQKIAADINRRVEGVLKQMSLEEKVEYISGMRMGSHGPGKWDGPKGNKRLGIAPFKIYHGPYGIGALRYTRKNGVYYPSSINMACTWNPELIQEVTTSMSKELKAAGGQSNAGPAMNIIRDLRGGRSMEYFTEDPYLNGQMATSYIKGIQSQGNFAIMKHYICNNQERERNYIDVQVGERALREIYLPGYKRAVIDGGVLGVMTGYNTINGNHASANKHLIQDILKDEWGFKGIVMTDWSGSADDPIAMIKAGTDLEMPRPKTLTPAKVLKAINQGEITESDINEMVRRILYVSYFTGVMDGKPEIKPDEIATPHAVALARKMAEESIVLLKNKDHFLPLDRSKVRSIAVIGPNGAYGTHFRNGTKSYQLLQGGGSASIAPAADNMITPYAGIKKASKDIKVAFEPGCYGDHGCTIIQPEFFSTSDGKQGLQARYYPNNSLKGKSQLKVDKHINFTWHKTPDII